MLLEKYREAARRAHYWTSFVPEKRAEQTVSEFSEKLTNDLSELKEGGVNDEVLSTYQQKFERFFSGWLSAKSRCASSMIAGPANFNVRRAEKANRSEERHYQIFSDWRERAKKAILRKQQPEKTFLSEIDRYTAELESLKANHEKMKEANKKIKKAREAGEDISEYLMQEHGVKPHMVEWTMNGFHLSNSSANIRRVEDRLKLMEKKEERANTVGANEIIFEGGKVIYNHEADRIQVIHDEKPDDETRNLLKRNGFRWSPKFGAWQRNLNQNGIFATQRILKIELPNL